MKFSEYEVLRAEYEFLRVARAVAKSGRNDVGRASDPRAKTGADLTTRAKRLVATLRRADVADPDRVFRDVSEAASRAANTMWQLATAGSNADERIAKVGTSALALAQALVERDAAGYDGELAALAAETDNAARSGVVPKAPPFATRIVTGGRKRAGKKVAARRKKAPKRR
jgi:hypothetical protein